ncbi:MAG: cytochrome-c peroxidase [Flavobacteriales bacterium]
MKDTLRFPVCRSLWLCLSVASVVLLTGCREDVPAVEHDLTPFVIAHPSHVVPPMLPLDNPLTEAKVALGRMLFHETSLSGDGTMSCATCHLQSAAMTDTAQLSVGIRGLEGHRNAMSVFNMAWNNNGFFWDGRAELLRDQSLMPIQDSLEMDETLEDAAAKVAELDAYQDAFVRAFGDEEVTATRMSLAMEQFMLTITSFQSKYDRYLGGEEVLTESELRGLELFTTEYNEFFPEYSGADCQHCHGGPNFSNNQYMNNGLDEEGDWGDEGRMLVTGLPGDRGKFKVTSLRNIALTAPYMHDGRFNTLEEVIDHYDHGLKPSSTLDPALAATMSTGLMLTEQDKLDLLAFLHCLTDESLAENEAFSSPFD